MNLNLHSTSISDLSTPLLVVPVFTDSLGNAFDRVDAAMGGLPGRIAKEEEFEGKPGTMLLVRNHEGASLERVLLVGLGALKSYKPANYRAVSCAAVKEANKRRLTGVSCMIPDGSEQVETLRFGVEGGVLGGYRYVKWLTRDVKELTCKALNFLASDGSALDAPIDRFSAIAEGVNFARDLVNGPPSEVHPAYLADVATQIAKENDLELEIFEEDELVKRKMNLLMAVGTGSAIRPRLIHLTYRPAGATKDTRSIAFVGKGVTFDAGGYNIKPTGSMEDMKMDMAGSATVLGLMKVIQSVAPDCVVHGIVPTVENLVSSTAYKPGDIYKAANGKSVEIMNTDAEGRLILADALWYADSLGPDKIVDLATLTGACVVALGPHMAGIFSNDDEFSNSIKEAADRAGEDMWPMPLAAKLKPMLKSPAADMKNIGQRWGGAITAALFLEEFVGDRTWAHLDIAGPAFADKAEGHIPVGGTGFGVLTLVQLLEGERA
jgi:leucyl aminopeptidase